MRTIREIQSSMEASIKEKGLTLSPSAVAEWRLWAYVFAVCVHSFELVLDVFQKEIDTLTSKITPGTVRWYAEMCYRFQNGHELLFDPKTAMLFYAQEDEKAKIVKVVAVTEGQNRIFIKAAKIDANGKIIPLKADEIHNFSCYVDAIKFAGVQTDVISTTEDKIRYEIDVYFNPSIPSTTIADNVKERLQKFKTEIGFDSMIYKQKFIDAIMSVEGVVTCDLKTFERKGASMNEFVSIQIFAELESGYFEYDAASKLTPISIKEIKQA
ncbi:MAG: hypothetical protein RR328_04700 [Bacteroidales bacterium]